MNKKLYIWGDKVKGITPADHTWVTSYQPGTGEPDPKLGDYWYCHGVTRNEAKLINEGTGGVDFANMISKPNDKNDTVGIDYLIGGVCHQIANRLTRFSFDDDNQPITAQGAIGYNISVAMYGKYGEKVKIRSQQKNYLHWMSQVEAYQKGG